MIKFSLVFTASKLLAYMICIIGSVYGFYYSSGEIMITAFTVSASLLGVKTWIDRNNTSVTNINTKKETTEKTKIEKEVETVIKNNEDVG